VDLVSINGHDNIEGRIHDGGLLKGWGRAGLGRGNPDRENLCSAWHKGMKKLNKIGRGITFKRGR